MGGYLLFLVEPYTPRFYYMELVECYRRLFLTAALVLIDFDVTVSEGGDGCHGAIVRDAGVTSHWAPPLTRLLAHR